MISPAWSWSLTKALEELIVNNGGVSTALGKIVCCDHASGISGRNHKIDVKKKDFVVCEQQGRSVF